MSVTVVFEILSPGNRAGELRRKLAVYERHGAEDYYILDPDFAKHQGYRREAEGKLAPIADLLGWISPRLGIRFEMTRQMKQELRIIAPDGRPFEHYIDIARKLGASERQIDQADRRAEAERGRAEAERGRADRLLAQLRALGLEPDA